LIFIYLTIQSCFWGSENNSFKNNTDSTNFIKCLKVDTCKNSDKDYFINLLKSKPKKIYTSLIINKANYIKDEDYYSYFKDYLENYFIRIPTN
jgi:hypothetical protein